MRITTKLFAAVVSAFMVFALQAGPQANEAGAQMAFGAQGNWGSEADFGVGARLLTNITGSNLEAVGSVDAFFPDGDVNWLDINANLFYHLHLPDSPSVIPYLGAGLNLARLSNGASETEAGLNLGGGIRFPGASATPFIEVRGVVSDADQFVVTGGILFGTTRYR